MTALLIATRNAHKVREIRQVLGADYLYLALNDFPGAPAAVEDGATFAANAAKKVNVLADWLATMAGRAALLPRPNLIPSPGEAGRGISPSLYILADDSGLEVDVLDGAPGVHSARFAALDNVLSALGADPPGGNSPDHANNAKLLRLLKPSPNPSHRPFPLRPGPTHPVPAIRLALFVPFVPFFPSIRPVRATFP